MNFTIPDSRTSYGCQKEQTGGHNSGNAGTNSHTAMKGPVTFATDNLAACGRPGRSRGNPAVSGHRKTTRSDGVAAQTSQNRTSSAHSNPILSHA